MYHRHGLVMARKFEEKVNYRSYAARTYNRNITRIIPGYADLHRGIAEEVRGLRHAADAIELGPGTGNTTLCVMRALPEVKIRAIEMLPNMAAAVRNRFRRSGQLEVLQADYFDFMRHASSKPQADLVFSAIGVHHLSDRRKKLLFKYAYGSLRPGGTFVFADLMDFEDAKKNLKANMDAMRLLLKEASGKKIAAEWLDHWLNLNMCATVEKQINWLREAGFGEVRHPFERMTTNLLIAKKC